MQSHLSNPIRGRMANTETDITKHVKVKFFGGLANLVGRSEVDIPVNHDGTLGNLLDILQACFPEVVGKLRPRLENGSLTILINGRYTRFHDGLDSRLPDGAVVAFLPPIGGG